MPVVTGLVGLWTPRQTTYQRKKPKSVKYPTLNTFCTCCKPKMFREVHNFPSLTFGLVSLQLARALQISLQVCRRLENPDSGTHMSMALSGNTYVRIGNLKPICSLVYHPLQREWSQPSRDKLPLRKEKIKKLKVRRLTPMVLITTVSFPPPHLPPPFIEKK